MINPNHKTAIFIIFTRFLIFFHQTNASPSPPVTALFSFGDSTMDPGNNNYIATIFQGNHPPYGKDFPEEISTGRFSDGKLTADFMSEFLGLKPILPPYLDPSVKPADLLTGVSFASAGGGLDDETVRLSLSLHMDEELSYFEEAIGKMKNVVGVTETDRVIKNALFVISVGTNDMVFNVYDRLFGSSISLSKYQDGLLNKLQGFIKRLFEMGARRIIVAGLPPIGCLPVQVTIESLKPSPRLFERVCSKSQNKDSRLYNRKLQRLILYLNKKLLGSKIFYFDIYSPIMDMINHPHDYGLEDTNRGCCGTGLIEAGPFCEPLSPTCDDPSKYLFFDSIHPTQNTYFRVAQNASETLFPLI